MDKALIRNFAIIAHVDHGKSTLSDRFLEITGTIRREKLENQEQFLDQNPISRERGITIKLAPVRMMYKYPIPNTKYQILNKETEGATEVGGPLKVPAVNEASDALFGGDDRQDPAVKYEEFQLNLIDTPGHVDFSYEVSRTLAACEGVILLVDATKGVQAQTVAHLKSARKEGLVIIPAVNKIDAPLAHIEKVVKQLENLGFSQKEIFFISAKTGQNIDMLLRAVVEKIPAPQGSLEKKFKALIFDAVYDEHRGVVAFVRVLDGSIHTNTPVQLFQTKVKTNAIDVGYFTPSLVSSGILTTGEIGYIVTGIKNIRLCRVGDTIFQESKELLEPFPGYTTPQPMVFFGVYPKSTDELVALKEAINKLALIDASLSFSEEYSAFLGSGFRMGFLGLLHADIFRQRLKREFGLEPLFTLPHVLYEGNEVDGYKEPYMHLTILVPKEYVGGVMTVCQKKRGKMSHMEYQDDNVILEYDMPYAMFLKGLSSDLKSVSSGFASLDYILTTYESAEIVNLEIKINDKPIDVLSEFAYKDEAEYVAREKTGELKSALPRQQVKQVIQCCIGSRVLSRDEIPPFRKDVLAKMSGGDRTRKDKLLEAQKKGKEKMSSISKVEIPQEALFKMVSSD